MALVQFKEVYNESYQDIVGKSMVSAVLANTRFESELKFGDTVHRFKLDLSSVRVRDVVRYQDQTIDPLQDSDQTLVIDQQKGAAFPIHRWDEVQAGPLDPAREAGKQVALKIKRYIDASVLSSVRDSAFDFDTGNLTTGASTGTPISLSTTNAPQMLAQLSAFGAANNMPEGDWVAVMDPYNISIFAQTLMGKNIDVAGSTFKNGMVSKDVGGFRMLVSNALTGEAVLSMATQPTDGDTVTVNGVVFTFKATPVLPGAVDIGANVDGSRANLAAAINAGAGAGTTYIELSAANRLKFSDDLRLTATNDDTANTLTVVGIGSGRLTVSETFIDATDTWTKNFIHAYVGKAKQIDLVVQDGPRAIYREEPKQDTVNILNNVLYGKGVFDDAARNFIDVHLAA